MATFYIQFSKCSPENAKLRILQYCPDADIICFDVSEEMFELYIKHVQKSELNKIFQLLADYTSE